MPYSIQPSYEELQKTQKHPVAVALEAAMQGKMAYNQAQEFKAKQEAQKQEAYFAYRKSGLSQSEAWNRSQMAGPAPSGEDVVGMEQRKTDLEARKGEADIKLSAAQAAEKEASAGWLNRVGTGDPNGYGAVMDPVTHQLRPAKPGEQPQYLIRQTKEGQDVSKVPDQPGMIPADKAGLATLANEAVGNIQKARATLFPGGNANSFDRAAAASATLPMTGKPLPGSQKGQDLYRWMTAALAARQLIQTGVAARPEETDRLMSAFAANLYSNPQAAYDALAELESFYNNYQGVLTSKQLPGNQSGIPQVGAQQTSITPRAKSFVDSYRGSK